MTTKNIFLKDLGYSLPVEVDYKVESMKKEFEQIRTLKQLYSYNSVWHGVKNPLNLKIKSK